MTVKKKIISQIIQGILLLMVIRKDSGWKKTSKSDPSKTFLSLAVSDFQEKPEGTPGPQPTANPVSDEDLPF